MKSKVEMMMTVVAVVALVAVGGANAMVLDYEPFDLPIGPIDDNPPWTTGTNPVGAPTMSYPGLPTSGNQIDAGGTGANRPAPAIDPMFTTEGTYFVTYIGERTSGAAHNLQFLGQNPNHPFPGFWMHMQGGGGVSDTMLYEIYRGNAGVTEGSVPINLASNETHLFAWRFINQAGDDQISLVVDPTLPGEPDWDNDALFTAFADITVDGAAGIRYFVGSAGGSWDEFRFTTTWPEAIGVPEPATLSLLALGGLALLKRRR